MSFLHRISNFITSYLERFFLRWGKLVSNYPYHVVFVSLILTAACSLGFLSFRMEHKANLLWIPLNSEYNKNTKWLDNNFKKTIRNEMVVMKGENVLTPKAIQKMFKIHKAVNKISVEGKGFSDLCTRIPITDIFQTRRRKKRDAKNNSGESVVTEDPFYDIEDDYYGYWDPAYYDDDIDYEESITASERINFDKYAPDLNFSKMENSYDNVPTSIYCDIVNTLNEKCLEQNLLEIWRFSESLINTTTTEEILAAVNKLQISPWFGHKTDFSQLLGGILRNGSGYIIGAKAVRMVWSVRIPDDAVIVESQGSGLELELGDALTLSWEEEFVNSILEENSQSNDEYEIIPNAVKSYGEVSSEAIYFDGKLMVCGYILMFIYTTFMLGRLSCIELKLFLSLAGICSILMGLSIGIGISSVLNYPWTPMHVILPFICLGIGIDDMFVIVQCLRYQKNQQINSSVEEALGSALKHAGVSITVTSVTDILAFGVGAVTNMPGLQSFCVATSFSLGAIFLLQLSWFSAWLSLDLKRINSRRNAFLPCFHHSKEEEDLGKKEHCNLMTDQFLKGYRTLLSYMSYRIAILFVSFSCLGCGVWGFLQIRHKFDPLLLLPSDSYLSHFIRLNDRYYRPYEGWTADIYTGMLNSSNLQNIEDLVTQLEELKTKKLHIQDYSCWWTDFKNFLELKTNHSSWHELQDMENFQLVFSNFIFSTLGSKYRINFKLDGDLICNNAAPSILASKCEIQYFPFDGPEDHIPAKDTIDQLISNSGLQNAFSFVKIYAAWETDRIIGFELWRNVGLAFLCVFLVTIVFLGNLRICFMVMSIVGMTLVEVIGFLHFWNITIDIISCISVVISIGLCVDYSVHIGHAYKVAEGSQTEKAIQSIESIGPAVLNGGFTTFLALVLLAGSTSHTFLTFFKVFFFTVIFGLFHGLILLPVILALFGPTDEIKSNKDGSNIFNSKIDQDEPTVRKDRLEPSWIIPVFNCNKSKSWTPRREAES